jgi:phytoene/squalene synthetase
MSATVDDDRLAKRKRRAAAQLELFARRCLDLADAVAENRMAFLDTVDMAYEAAVWAGLTETVGDDIVQATMAAAFANARRPA